MELYGSVRCNANAETELRPLLASRSPDPFVKKIRVTPSELRRLLVDVD